VHGQAIPAAKKRGIFFFSVRADTEELARRHSSVGPHGAGVHACSSVGYAPTHLGALVPRPDSSCTS
jgi:hypothetical protein